ncbi:class I SAM-dependent methyltransferase [Streptomyces mobaraensis]|uniref:Methyltransferase domain-containing protein n=1 Tax=Streptomyces mobaraensis TaxID=35621 RepID=A0A5N5W389_STRMB|nr:methyltransferase domain-containing protein [Streptomyces mobaraensis]KAB7837207.1 methyltransferase domain-containing protein [Streptomyces mobaraensis]
MSLRSGGEDQLARNRQEFARQASTFEDARLNTAFTMRLRELVEFAAPRPEDVCLEVACGTGLVSRALAGRVRHVTALDATPEMLATGKREADAEGLTQVVYQQGDAARLPFLDASFSLVVTRFSLHHVASPEAVVRELVRVCRPGGRIVVADMVRRPELGGDPDRIERLRDPSHGAMLTVDRITELFTAAGGSVRGTEVLDVQRPLGPWLEQARTPAETAARIESELAEELAGGPVSGMRPVTLDGRLHYTQSWVQLLAVPD